MSVVRHILILGLIAAFAPGAMAQEGGENLLDARKGHETKLTAEERDESQLQPPPAELFSLVQYPTDLGDMSAYVSTPKEEGKKYPAIIWLVGGLPVGGADSFVWEDADPNNDQSARAYREAGLIMMYPALRGTAGNPGNQESFYGEVNDVLSALAFLKTLDYVDADRIYLGGHSTGGTLALLVAESTDDFKAVISFGPVSDPAGYGGDNLTYDVDDEKECRLRAPIYFLDEINTPTYVIEGENGNHESPLEMKKATKNKSVHFISVKGADHFAVLAPLNKQIAATLFGLKSSDAPELKAADLQNAYDAALRDRLRQADVATLASLKEAGVEFSKPVDADHYLFAWEKDALTAAVRAAKKSGLQASEIQEQVDEEGDTYFVTVIWKPLRLSDEKAVFELTRTVYRIAQEAGAEYGGWGVE